MDNQQADETGVALAQVMIVQLDRDDRVQFVNRAYAEALGRPPRDLLGKLLSELLSDEAHARIKPNVQAALSGQCVECEWEESHPGLGAQHLRCACEPVRDAAGSVVGYLAVILNLTECKRTERALKESEARLKEVERRKDNFLATLAHELRNPLAPIRNGLELLRRAGKSRAMTEQAHSMMERQLVHLVQLIDDLLDVSRLARGALELSRARVDLSDIVRAAVETRASLIEASGADLILQLAPEPTPIDADAARLVHVFTNLLSNAATYVPPGGKIWVVTEKVGKDVVARIKDNGAGIPPERMPRLFEMSAQVEEFPARSHRGLGLGLALVKGLVDLHGGSLEARSFGVGLGSEFIIRLPIAQSKPASPEAPAPAGIGPTMPVSRRILVADDNEDVVVSLALLLKGAGHQVRSARDGLEAVQAAEAFLPEVVLLDVGMPHLNGYDAARRIRKEKWGQEMVLIAITGWDQDEDRRQALEAGFNAHLVKPVDPLVLQQLLNRLPV